MPRSLLALAAAAILATSARADDRFSDLVRWIPPDVNLFVVADLNAIYGSPLATNGKWATAAPLDGFSPLIQYVVLGSKVAPGTLQEQVEYGVGYMKVNLTMEQLAKREGGARDTIAEADAVLSPRNCYFVAVAPFAIGMTYPASRQDAAKWVRFGRQNAQPKFSPPIQAGIASIAPATQFVLVLDVADSIQSDELRSRIGRSKALKGVNAEAAATVLASTESLRLELTVKEFVTGTLTVTFGTDVAPIAPAAKNLLQEVLARHGASLDDIEGWTATANGTTITYRGPLSETSFRRLVSVLTPPAPHLDEGQVDPNNPLAEQIRLQASKLYLQTIQKQLDSLKKPPSKVKQNYQEYEMWYDKAADSIGQMPTSNVDPNLLKYGQLAFDSLKAIAASARGENVQVTKAEGTFKFGIYNTGALYGGGRPWGGGGFGRRGYGGGGIFLDTNMADVNQAKQKAIDEGTQARNDIWTNLMAETDKIKRAMYDRFKVPF